MQSAALAHSFLGRDGAFAAAGLNCSSVGWFGSCQQHVAWLHVWSGQCEEQDKFCVANQEKALAAADTVGLSGSWLIVCGVLSQAAAAVVVVCLWSQ